MEPILTLAGPMGMVILVLGGLSALVALGLAGAALTGRRVPLTAWLVAPMLVVAVGAFATWSQAGQALNAAAAAGPDLSEVAASGLAQAWAADYLARWVAAGVLVLSAWGAALGAVRTGKYALWTPFAGIMTILSGLIGAILVGWYAMSRDLESSAYTISGLLLLGSIGVGIGAMRRAYHDEAFRVAGMRFTSAVLLFLGVVQAARGLVLGYRMDIYNAQATVVPDALEELVTGQIQHLADVNTLAWIAIIGAFVAAVFAFVAELGEVVQRYTVWDTFAATVVLTLVVGVRVVELTRVDTMQEIALLRPSAEVIDEFAYNLPAASVLLDGDFYDAHFRRSGFGDVLVYRAGEDEEPGAWVRTYRWTGKGWEPDDTPLAEAQLDQTLAVLLAIPSDQPAPILTDVLEQLGGEATLLLRAGELADDPPDEAAHLQGTLLPLRLSTERDLSTELWVDADKMDLYYGPIRVFGEGTDVRDMARRIDAAYAKHEGVGNLHVAVAERARMSQIAEVCVAAKVEPYGDFEADDEQPADGEEAEGPPPEEEERGIRVREGVWCALTDDEPSAFIDAAVDTVELEQPDDVSMSIDSENVLEGTEATLARELPALAWCRDLAEEERRAAAEEQRAELAEGEEPEDPIETELAGTFRLEFRVDDQGRARDWSYDEGNIDDRLLRSCIRERIGKARFPEVPEPAEEGEQPAEPEGEEEPEPRTVELVLSYR